MKLEPNIELYRKKNSLNFEHNLDQHLGNILVHIGNRDCETCGFGEGIALSNYPVTVTQSGFSVSILYRNEASIPVLNVFKRFVLYFIFNITFFKRSYLL